MDDQKLREILNEMLSEWIEILCLQEWDIKIKLKTAVNMKLEDVQGEVNMLSVARQAIISILNPIDFDNPDFPQDIEKTVIHELLHIKFSNIESEETPLTWLEHQLIDDLAKALIKTKRKWGNK